MVPLLYCARYKRGELRFYEIFSFLCYLSECMAKLVAAPSREILEAALTGLEAQREKLEEQILQVRSMLGSKMSGGKKAGALDVRGEKATKGAQSPATVAVRKRVLSPEARKRIATAQKKRWAAFRKGR
jgi:hypothetical protein